MMSVHDWFGTATSPGWIVVYVIVLVLLIGALWAFGRRKKREMDREHARSLRAMAAREEPHLAQQERVTRRLEAESREARAEAERREAAAAEQRERWSRQQARHADRLAQADDLDPDADTDSGADAEAGSEARSATADDVRPRHAR
jgi:FtsZ-interacting cell division protein ZipA